MNPDSLESRISALRQKVTDMEAGWIDDLGRVEVAVRETETRMQDAIRAVSSELRALRRDLAVEKRERATADAETAKARTQRFWRLVTASIALAGVIVPVLIVLASKGV